MSAVLEPMGQSTGAAGWLDKERTIAGPGFNRWLVPPAALAIHLCIGMAYGFSVFWLPLSKAIGVTTSQACPADMSLMAELFTTTCDWRISSLGWMYTLFFVLLGCSAALWGGWLERAGPRKAGVVSALCWCGGLVISALGIYSHQLWLLWLGSGVIGGIGLGLGYISPVSTLIKWFPDRRGMASPMLQEVFGGQLIGVTTVFSELDKGQLAAIAGIAAGFTALLSLFNIGGRFLWASASDMLGRKTTYSVFFILGGLLYFSIPSSAAGGSQLLFVGAVCIILSMYGGCFATVPAYLADLFGTQMVGAIHGRLLTAWATAGIIGPVVVNYMREYQIGLGLPRAQVYNQTMYILVAFLVVGLICNLMIRPLNQKWFMTPDELAHEKHLAHDRAAANEVGAGAAGTGRTPTVLVALGWTAVGIPMVWGVWRTLGSAAKFFQ